jgi:aspartate/methionine/tyrosine aminotransferase
MNPSLRGAQSILESFSSLKNYLSLRTNTLSEVIAPWVLEKHAEISSKNRSLIKSNIEHLYSLDPDQLAFDLSQIPQNNIEGLCIFPRMKDESVIDQLWTEEGVFAAKGVNFGEKWGKYLRIGLKDKFSTKSATIP